MFWKDVSVDDLVQVFLVKIIDREAARDRQVQTIGACNVVVEGNAEKNVQRFRNFGHLAEERPIVASYPRAALESRVYQNDQRQFAGLFRGGTEDVRHGSVKLG